MRIYPLMRYKFWYVAVLGAVTVFAFLAIFVLGLKLGIEFNGGVSVEVKLAQPATTADVRQIMDEVGVNGAGVQSVGSDSFVITAQEMTDAQFEQAVAKLQAAYGAQKSATGLERIGPTFGKETAQRALIAILVSIVVMIIYLGWRFDLKFALPAIVALIHDVGLTLGVYAVTGRLVTTATVAAVLTILGYSINDTIIVFDRIRENTLFMKKESYSDMVDFSIRQTLARSINTSLTTLLPIAAILLFGGATLKDFAFALFIGIASGTYSSIFVASPLLVMWKERETKYRKRLVTGSTST